MRPITKEEIACLLTQEKPLKERRGERRKRDQEGGAPYARLVGGKVTMVAACERVRQQRQALPTDNDQVVEESNGWHPEPDYTPAWQRELNEKLVTIGRIYP